MLKSALIALLLMASGLAAMAQTQPTLKISFDDGFDAVGPNGPVVGTPVGKPELAPGKFGRALKSGPETGFVDYPTAGILNPAGGTVEMWVCPLDWIAADEEFHVFFDARGEGALYLYKYYQGTNLLMLSCDNVNGPYTSCVDNIAAWKPGEWHHIAGTWSASGIMAYVDGKPAMAAPLAAPLPKSLGKFFRIGDDPWHIKRKSSSLVDEVRIYDRALSSAHIAAHFKGDYGFVAPLSRDIAVLKYELDPLANTLQASVLTGGADVEDARLSARLALVAKGQPLPADAARAGFTGGTATVALPMLSRKAGDYEVVAAVSQDDKPAFELRRDFVIPSMAWIGNKLGLEDKVLPPWTPLRAAGTTLSCWGRDYAFGQAALPTQITSAGSPLLSRPISVTASAGGPVAWRQTVRPGRHSDTRAELTGEITGKAGGAPVTLRTKITAEYDGVVLVEMSADNPDKLPLDTLSVDIPVKSAHAIYRHRWAPTWEGLTGNLPEGNGVVDKDKFIPYYWLGDNDRGLFWFCESDEFWPNGDSPNAIEVVRSGDETVLRLNLLAKGQKLAPNWKFAFGLQATPVKPIPRDWRKWRLQPATRANVAIMWPTPAPNSLRYYGYPEATDPKLFAGEVDKLHAQKTLAVPYLCLSFISAACPEWPYFSKVWGMGGGDSGSSDVAAYGAMFAMASPVGKGYADFIVWKNKQFIDTYKIDGLYHDNSHPYPSTNMDAGCGYMRDGQVRQTFPILGFRSLYRRMYAVMKSENKPTFTMAHMSGKVTIPILGYDDSYLDGEHFSGRMKDSYLDLIGLDTFRAEFMGRQWGIMPFFIPELRAPYDQQVEPTRGMMALLMIHDVSPWAIWCNVKVLDEAWDALDKFGYVNASFIPYFDPQPPASTDMKDTYVSAYKRADGATLLIVANLGKEDRSGTVRINAKRLGLSAKRVVDWPSAKPVETKDGSVALDVPRLGYRMLMVEK
jgi:hypothetical protein